MTTVISMIGGAFVCIFGMWAFLKGQADMVKLMKYGECEKIKGPASVFKEAKAKVKTNDNEVKNYRAQIQAMFSEPRS